MAVVGIDPSLTSTGFAYYDSQAKCHTGRIRPNNLRDLDRLRFIEGSILKLLAKVEQETGERVTHVAYEDYAMGKGGKGNPGRVFSIGEAGGIMKMALHKAGVSILLVSPGSLKKFITGKGNTPKDEIPYYIAEHWGYNVQQNDEADAFGLLKMAEAFVSPRGTRKGYRKEALEACSLLPGI